MKRYILAAKLDGGTRSVSVDVARRFPGFVVVSDGKQGTLSVDALPQHMAEFRRLHGRDFLIEAPKPRALPEKPVFALADTGPF